MMCLPAGLGTVALGGGSPPSEFIPVSWNMSSFYGAPSTLLQATVAKMRDGDFTTGAATNAGTPGGEWIEANLGAPKLVNNIEVAGGTLGGGWGGVQVYLNTRELQYWDGAAWQIAATVAGASDSSPFLVNIPIPGITAQLWRLYGVTYTATTEFRFFP